MSVRFEHEEIANVYRAGFRAHYAPVRIHPERLLPVVQGYRDPLTGSVFSLEEAVEMAEEWLRYEEGRG